MEVIVNGIVYESIYFPYRCTGDYDEFSVYELKYPSGAVDEILVFDDPVAGLQEHSVFLIKEFLLEDDDMLTPRAMAIKKDLGELFRCKET